MTLIRTLIGFLVTKAAAADGDTVGNPFERYCRILYDDGDQVCSSGAGFLGILAERSITFFATLIGGASILVIIYGSIRLITSAGNDQGKETAKNIIIAALVGLIFAIAAHSIMYFVDQFVSPENISGL